MPLDKNLRNRVYAKRERPLILVTNDDGIASEGISLLADSLKNIGDVIIVAPSVEQSATSHSVTLHHSLRCRRIDARTYIVDGTPTDCVNLAVNFLFKDAPPDLLFSGINRGPNLGDDIHYSGTVSAAMEGGIMGVPSVAISVSGPLSDALAGRGGFKFAAAAEFALKVAKKVLNEGLPKGVILNVNVPNVDKKDIKGYRLTFQGIKNYSNVTTEHIDPRGERYYWISGKEDGFDDIEGSDCNAIAENSISITPLKVDMTDRHFMKTMKDWRF